MVSCGVCPRGVSDWVRCFEKRLGGNGHGSKGSELEIK